MEKGGKNYFNDAVSSAHSIPETSLAHKKEARTLTFNEIEPYRSFVSFTIPGVGHFNRVQVMDKKDENGTEKIYVLNPSEKVSGEMLEFKMDEIVDVWNE